MPPSITRAVLCEVGAAESAPGFADVVGMQMDAYLASIPSIVDRAVRSAHEMFVKRTDHGVEAEVEKAKAAIERRIRRRFVERVGAPAEARLNVLIESARLRHVARLQGLRELGDAMEAADTARAQLKESQDRCKLLEARLLGTASTAGGTMPPY